jgi:hypothetical protein
VTFLYSLALLVSAALMFLLEPMVGKFVLPLVGSAPQVWPTTVLFFQATLLAGYAFAHVTSRLPARRQALLQLGVLALPALVLPLGVPGGQPPVGNPIPWLLGVLAVTAGLPFFALAANGPMVQRWLASTRHRAARDPYFLFAASNGGSLLGLLAYPLLGERLLGLSDQGRAWSVGYVLAALLVAASVAALWLRPAAERPAPATTATVPERAAASEPVRWRRRLLWLALAAVPSSLMLGTTSFITRDLAPVPLLWVLPLALYLLTFVVAFSPWTNAERLTVWGRRLMPAAAIAVTYTLLIRAERPLGLLLAIHLAGLVVVGLLCHGRLAADRPNPSRLTEFYLWVALGGALGGAFNAVVAPLVFPGLVEYPLAIVAACLLRPSPPKKRPELLEFFLDRSGPTRWMDLGVPLLLGSAVALVLAAADSDATTSVVAGLACGLTVNMSRRPLRFGLALGAVFLAVGLVGLGREDTLDRDRSFFGVYSVIAKEGGRLHELYSGTTLHGAERTGNGPPHPLSYYSPVGPVGQAFAELPRRTIERIGAIGLGSGTLGCFAPAGGEFTFYEIDKTVVRIARDRRLFSFLRDCKVQPRVVLGDGRRSLERAPPAGQGLIVVDAFNSDAIPVHLITREAVRLYLSRISPNGALMFHLSNRYLDLEPVLGNVARDLSLSCLIQNYKPHAAERKLGYTGSKWALLARAPTDLGVVSHDRRWQRCRDAPSARTWTDDYSNPLSVIHWG